MPEVIKIECGSKLTYRRTPWDERALDVSTCEILSIDANTDESITRLLKEFDKVVKDQDLGLITTRAPADSRVVISELQTAGFRYLETSLRMCLQRVQKFEAPKKLSRGLELREATLEDLDQLKVIATSDFRYGRFAEDPCIPRSLNDLRQSNWIDDIFTQELKTWVIDSQDEVAAFMSVRIDEQDADLILGGCREGLGVLFMPFTIAIIEQLKQQEVRSIFATISAANLGVLNCYTGLGFYAKTTLVGLHRHVVELGRSGA